MRKKSCKWCFHLKTCKNYLLVRCEIKGFERIVLNINDLFTRKGAANLQAIEFREYAMVCKRFCANGEYAECKGYGNR